MKTVRALIYRNIKLFFKDKGLFFTSLITPLILLVLYATFLSNVYRDSFLQFVPEQLNIPDSIIDGCVSGQLLSSLLAVCCVTVSFCSNMLMVQDKVNGAANDMAVSPVNSTHVAFGYYIATTVSTLVISLIALGAGLAYVAASGWYMSTVDVLWLICDVFVLVSFGTALSSVINFFLSSQGAISAVGSIVSSCYGFICGAYMPISQFSEGLQKVLSFIPCTYATSLIRTHAMRGALNALEDEGMPESAVESIKDMMDCNLYFFDEKVSGDAKLVFVLITVAVLIAVYVALNIFSAKKAKKA